jgi:solute:Na+ symporter, SSS family
MIPFSTLDWVVLAIFFAILLGVVIWSFIEKEKDTTDYFLAGRNAGWLVIGASIFASNIGSEHLVGLSGAGAQSGMAMAHWELQSWIIILLGWVFAPFYWSAKVYTMPEFLERRYSSASRTFLSFVSLVSYVLTKVSVTVYAGGVVLKTVLGIDSLWGIDFFWIAAMGLVIVTGLYTVAGGMKAILVTSVIQTPILIIGSVVILVVGLDRVGGFAELERINGEQMRLMRPISDPDFPWPGVIFGSIIIGFWYWLPLVGEIRRAEQRLQNYSKDLEAEVASRTEDLQRTNQQLQASQDRIAAANRQIMESIHYASRIQSAVYSR